MDLSDECGSTLGSGKTVACNCGDCCTRLYNEGAKGGVHVREKAYPFFFLRYLLCVQPGDIALVLGWNAPPGSEAAELRAQSLAVDPLLGGTPF